jgi:hypothetical protein
MKKFFGAHISEDPGFTTIQQFAENQSVKELRPFLQWDVLVVVKDFPVCIESSVCQGHSALHFNSMISFVMQDPSQMLILSYDCYMANLLLANNGHCARGCRAKDLLLASAHSLTSEREKELSFAFLKIRREAISFHGVKEQ